jgi:hypothetical protein
MLAVSAGLSADFSAGFSATAGFSTTVCSSMAFSEMPLALTPGSGILPAFADAAEGFASAFAPALLSGFFGSAEETAAAAGASAGLVAM